MQTGWRWMMALLVLLTACAGSEAPQPDPRGMGWADVERAARGAEVRLAMWTGDPAINRYMQDFIAPRLRERFAIKLSIVPAAGDIPLLLGNELAAGQRQSHLDVVWINGETFYKLRELDALFLRGR